MIAALLFWALTLICCGFAAAYGGWSGRMIAVLYLANVIATKFVTEDAQAWQSAHLPAFLVDAALLGGLIYVVARSDRWFPVWFAGLHLVAVSSHLAAFLAPGFVAKIYFLIQAVWALPMLALLVVGVSIDRRRGVFDERPILSAGKPPVP